MEIRLGKDDMVLGKITFLSETQDGILVRNAKTKEEKDAWIPKDLVRTVVSGSLEISKKSIIEIPKWLAVAQKIPFREKQIPKYDNSKHKILSWDDIFKFYKEKTGKSHKNPPKIGLYGWAVLQKEIFVVNENNKKELVFSKLYGISIDSFTSKRVHYFVDGEGKYLYFQSVNRRIPNDYKIVFDKEKNKAQVENKDFVGSENQVVLTEFFVDEFGEIIEKNRMVL